MSIFSKLFGSKKNETNSVIIIKDLNWKEFYERFNNSSNSMLLDVRTPEEYSQLRIPGSLLIDIHLPDFKERISKLDRNKEYFVYCKRGIRSMNAANLMCELGFTKIVNLTGGITTWEGPTETDI